MQLRAQALRTPDGGTIALAAICVVAVCALATQIPFRPGFALGVGVLALGTGVVLTAPVLLLAGVFVTTFAYWRVGPGTLNMSIGDATTVLAVMAALPFVPWRSRALRRILAGFVFYMLVLAVVVLATPTEKAMAEWAHRWILFAGALLIGAAAGYRKQTQLALKAFLLAAAVVAVTAIINAVTSGFQPAFPFGMHKNAAGPLMAMGVLILIAAPWEVGFRPSFVRHLRVLLIIGVFATQSRGAGLAVVAAIAIYAMRHPSARQRAPVFFLLIAIALLVVSAFTLDSETQDNPKFNGITLRENSNEVALDTIWARNYALGGGLRWFTDAANIAGTPHNVVVSELSESGIAGLAALLIVFGNTAWFMHRRRDPLGETAFLVLIFYLLFGLTAIFWIAGMVTMPMLLVGLAVGEAARSLALPSESKTTSNLPGRDS
jgi:hypothetical protein